MPAGVGQWVWVSDFKGFGLSDCDPRLAKVFLDLSAAHYPERLGLFLVIDAPWSVPSTSYCIQDTYAFNCNHQKAIKRPYPQETSRALTARTKAPSAQQL